MKAFAAFVCVVGLPSMLWADGAVVPMRTPAQVDVSVYEPGQKALIGWNGSCEVLILSTDVSAQEETKALQIVPLPSEPIVCSASFDVFAAAEKAMRRHAPTAAVAVADVDDGSGDREEAGAGPTIVFHKRIGAHDITVARAAGLSEFLEWTAAFVAKLGPERPEFGLDFQDVIVRLIREGVRYFAFDVITLDKDVASVQPISYVFDTDSLCYPLEVSSVVQGATDIQLFVISPFRLDLSGNKTPLRPALYHTFDDERPVRFSLSRSEIGEISDQVAALLGGRDGHFAALKYSGPLASLKDDLYLKFEERPFDPRSRELFLRKGE